MRRLAVVLMLAVALGAAVPAVAQVPAVQEALLAYLTNIGADYNAVGVTAVKARLDAGEKLFLLDVRQPDEFAAGRIQGAVNIPIRELARNLDKLPARDAAVLVICGSGVRAAYVTMALAIMGYTSVKDMGGGMGAWTAQGLPTVK